MLSAEPACANAKDAANNFAAFAPPSIMTLPSIEYFASRVTMRKRSSDAPLRKPHATKTFCSFRPWIRPCTPHRPSGQASDLHRLCFTAAGTSAPRLRSCLDARHRQTTPYGDNPRCRRPICVVYLLFVYLFIFFFLALVERVFAFSFLFKFFFLLLFGCVIMLVEYAIAFFILYTIKKRIECMYFSFFFFFFPGAARLNIKI